MNHALPVVLTVGAALLPILASVLPATASAPRVLRKEVIVDAPLDAVWHAWTTVEGLKFVSAKSNVELKIGGPYEWFLELEPDERGRRGGEGARVLAFLHQEMLAFDWTFPPSVPSLRSTDQKTQIVVLFDELEGRGVRVRFAQHGWGEGKDWEAGYAYFDRAWSMVLDRLKSGLESEQGSESK